MATRKRQGKRPPPRRIAPAGLVTPSGRAELSARLRYVGSASHKLNPSDYGFVPSHYPNPTKSHCGKDGVRLAAAITLFRRGIALGMFSQFEQGDVPKYVWSVDEEGRVYEAKTKPNQEMDYHGYRLGDDEVEMRRDVLREWRLRCQIS